MSNNSTFPFVYADEDKFDTELAAVWFIANYYYKESYLKGGEYTGIIFKKPNQKFGFTVRKDGGYSGGYVRWRDLPQGQGFILKAAWHTHIPGTRFCSSKQPEALVLCAAGLITDSLLGEYKQFSSADRTLSNNRTKLEGRPIPFYLITPTLIKRYTPGKEEKSWNKEVPERMKKIPF